MREDYDVDVLVVGAGPAGLTLSIQLARYGIPFRLIDANHAPAMASRGKGVQPRTQEIFEDIGILDDFLAISGSYPPLRIHAADGSVSERPFNVQVAATSDIPYPNMLMAPQWQTDAVLRQGLAAIGGCVEGGCLLERFEADEDGVTAHVASVEGIRTIRARYLVGTDGGRSAVRRALGIELRGETLDSPRMLFGDIHVDGLPSDAWARWPGALGDTGLCPLPHVDVFQLMIPLAPGETPELTESAAAALFRERTGNADLRLYDPTWLSIFTPNLRLADRYGDGRVFIAGDAAHVHPPSGAQGLNTSVQDSYNLGWKLALVLSGKAEPALLDTYEAERRPVGAGVLGLAASIQRAGASGGQVRDRSTQQLDLGYRESRLSMDDGRGERTVRAGDRAPDARIGEQRLFDLYRGTSFTLLLFGGATVDLPPADLVRVVELPLDGEAAATYQVDEPTAILIRPDNYIGLYVSSPAPAAVTAYFDETLGAEYLSQAAEVRT